ncbi:hypothetical protein [Desertivirga arenae]|uniref:hypothetical protein n=1 Tax=Desertivirga arenae TaxID=2810309 RepID=UPI001A9619AA|nr:hypothetical protein [Pedobacter sp. SYSU D00823]
MNLETNLIAPETSENQSISFKGIHANLNLVFILTLFGTLYILSFFFFISENVGVELLRLLGAALLSFFGARFLSTVHCSVTVNEEIILIESESNFLGLLKNQEWQKKEVTGFEINHGRAFSQLVIYSFDRKPYIISLTEITKPIEKFFTIHFRKLGSRNNLSRDTFVQAFRQSLFILSLILLAQIAVTFGIKHFLYPDIAYIPLSRRANLYFAIAALTNIFIFDRLHYKLGYRLAGKYAGRVVIIVNTVLLIVALNSYEGTRFPLKGLNKTEDIFKNRRDRFFKFQNRLNINLAVIGNETRITRGSGKSKKDQVACYLTTPVIFYEEDSHLFVGTRYNLNLPKTDNKDLFDKKLQDFHKRSRDKFINTVFTEEPTFYEVVYSDFNPSFAEGPYLSSAISTYRSIVPLIVIKPHLDNFNDFKQGEEFKGIAFFALTLLTISLAALISANKR